jgi:hypothetical protein
VQDLDLIWFARSAAFHFGASRLVSLVIPLMDPAAFRLAVLWLAWLLVLLFHVELGLMPLFHGRSVEIQSKVADSKLPRIFFVMLLYFLLPVLAMILAFHAASEPLSWSGSPLMRAIQFWFGSLYCFTNAVHLIADIRIPDSRSDQVLLMVSLTLIGLLLCLQAWQWWQG